MAAPDLSHHHTGDTPPQGGIDQPEAKPVRIDFRATGIGIGCEERFGAVEAARFLLIMAKSPARRAQIGKVLHRIAEPDQLPVEHCRQALLVDHKIAHPEIAVHQILVAGIGCILLEPVKGIFIDRNLAANFVIFVLLHPDQFRR